MSENKILEIKKLNIILPNFQINYTPFSLYEGDFIILKGENGSGKSTFIKSFRYFLNGNKYIKFEENSQMKYYYEEDEDINILKGKHKDILCRESVYISQEDDFESFYSIEDALKRPTIYAIEGNKKLNKKEKAFRLKTLDKEVEYYKNEFQEKFKDFNINDKYKNIKSYSGGQRKLIYVISNIIKAKVCRCRLLLMDEPLNNLDGKAKSFVNKEIQNLRNGNKLAIIMITHCQIFEGINGYIEIKDVEEFKKEAKLVKHNIKNYVECLE